jgi:serine/threonine-protein kinase
MGSGLDFSTRTRAVQMADPMELFGYKVLGRLGEGAASTLYAVQEAKTGQIWALKHVAKHTDKEQRFLDQVEKEHEIGSKLDHPNLRRIKRIHRKRKRFRTVELGLLMEFVDAPGLDVSRPSTVLKCVRVFEKIAHGLHHMHERGFVHADMKPTNVLVSKMDVKVIDLGQACAIGTAKKRIQGTPGYIAPEQAHRRRITPQTDVYNLGATMYWVLTGKVIPTALPPRSEQTGVYSGAVDADRIPPPMPLHERDSRIPESLSILVLECVRVARAARPSSIDGVATNLKVIGDEIAGL